MSDGNGCVEALLGLPGFRVIEVSESDAEVLIDIETAPGPVGCPGGGVVAEAHDRMRVEYRDLAVFGRPARLVWPERRWRCREPECTSRTWTETHEGFSVRCPLSDRAAGECCRQVGVNARPVAQMARELGVCWDTVMEAVREHGQPLIDASGRVGEVHALGVDETSWLGAWLAKEAVREIYLTDNHAAAELLIDRTIEGCRLDVVEEVRVVGRTLKRWRTEILNHHVTGAFNGPTEGLNLLIKKVKRAGHGFRNFDSYRLRILLHAGGVNWVEQRPPAPRIRTRSPR